MPGGLAIVAGEVAYPVLFTVTASHMRYAVSQLLRRKFQNQLPFFIEVPLHVVYGMCLGVSCLPRLISSVPS